MRIGHGFARGTHDLSSLQIVHELLGLLGASRRMHFGSASTSRSVGSFESQRSRVPWRSTSGEQWLITQARRARSPDARTRRKSAERVELAACNGTRGKREGPGGDRLQLSDAPGDHAIGAWALPEVRHAARSSDACRQEWSAERGQNAMTRHVTLLSGLVLFGCAGVAKERGHDDVAKIVHQRTGYSTRWEKGPPSDERIAHWVDELLRGGVTRDRLPATRRKTGYHRDSRSETTSLSSFRTGRSSRGRSSMA